MPHQPIIVRAAQADDSEALAGLFGQLGYPHTPAALARHWDTAFAASDAQALVAVDEARVLGVVVIHFLAPLHVPRPWALISALVVDAFARGIGIGWLLLAHAEQAALSRRCGRIELSSSEQRLRAHDFYLRHGYAEVRKRLVKVLPP